MKKLITLVLTLCLGFGAYAADDLKLWYDRPADYWVEALPLGNGHLGAMVYGGVAQDTIQINEDTFWSGSPYNNYNPNAKKHLAEIRGHINNGNYEAAQRLSMANITADKNITAHGMTYESIGNLILDFPTHGKQVSDYRRELDLSNAVAKVTYSVNGVVYTREIFTSLADDLIIIKISASKPGMVTFKTSFTGPLKKTRTLAETTVVKGSDNMLRVYCTHAKEAEENIPNKLHATAFVKVVADGGKEKSDAATNSISVTDANSAIIYISAATNFKNY